MAQYYKTHSCPISCQTNTGIHAEQAANAPVLSEFDKLRETLLAADAEEGWASKLLGTMQ